MRLNRNRSLYLFPVIATLAACSQNSPTAPSAASAIVTEGSQASRPSASGSGAPLGRHVSGWNLVGTPGDYEGGCGQGRRVFVERGARQAQIFFHDHDDGWHIEQCDATGGDVAEIGWKRTWERSMSMRVSSVNQTADCRSVPTPSQM